MSNNKPIRRIAIIGTGVIGASWTSLFLAKGLEVIATDIAPDAESSLRRFVKAAWPGAAWLTGSCRAPPRRFSLLSAPVFPNQCDCLPAASGCSGTKVFQDVQGTV